MKIRIEPFRVTRWIGVVEITIHPVFAESYDQAIEYADQFLRAHLENKSDKTSA
jgi:hypothetical protein